MSLATFSVVGLAFLLATGFAVTGQAPSPDCEQEPDQAGCDPACQEPTVDCEHPPCPTNLAGQVNEDVGTIFMSWTLNSRSDVRVYRATDAGAPEVVATLDFPTTRWVDQDVQPGHTYSYSVAAVGLDQAVDDGLAEGPESPRCGQLQISNVPFFQGPLATGAALVIVGLAAVLIRRR